MYDVLLNTTQILIMDNYLSSKYGNIAIDTDLYGMDVAGSGDHDHEVAGIGRTVALDVHTDAQSSIVRVSNPSALGNGDYLLFGHNNGALSPKQRMCRQGSRRDLPERGFYGDW